MIRADLLHKVADHIEANPDQLDMETWGWRDECGTVCCIAGWVALLSDHGACWRDDGNLSIASTKGTADLLGVSQDLFYREKWPDDIIGTTIASEAVRLCRELANGERDPHSLERWRQ